MVNKKIYYLLITALWFSILMLLVIFKYIDNDFAINNSSFINVTIFLTLIYLVILYVCFRINRKEKRILEKQMTVFEEHDYIIDELSDNLLLTTLYKKNMNLKRKITSMNEEQNRWVHDIKIPVATLKLYIQNNKDKLGTKDSKILNDIADKFTNDINKKIMYDKIELEIDDFKVDKIDVVSIVRKVIKENKTQFMYRKMSVDFEVEKLEIISDERTIMYAVEQIIANALKYGQESTLLQIYLKDNTLWFASDGEEIDDGDLKRLFDKGFTGKNSINKGMASTGLGLYLVKKSLNHIGLDIIVRKNNNITSFGIVFNKIL